MSIECNSGCCRDSLLTSCAVHKQLIQSGNSFLQRLTQLIINIAKMPRNYSKVPDDKRRRLIELIQDYMTIKDAAKAVDIKYENAKAIYRVYRKEQRTDKRRNRLRYKVIGKHSLGGTDAGGKLKSFKNKPKNAIKSKFEIDDDDEMSIDSQSSVSADSEIDDDSQKMEAAKPKVTGAKRNTEVNNQPLSMEYLPAHQQQTQKLQQQSQTPRNIDPRHSNVVLSAQDGANNLNQPSDCIQIDFKNMAPFSEQSSQFLQAKNLTAEGKVRDYEEIYAQPQPIKYGATFFERMEEQVYLSNKGAATKVVKSNNSQASSSVLLPTTLQNQQPASLSKDEQTNFEQDVAAQAILQHLQQTNQKQDTVQKLVRQHKKPQPRLNKLPMYTELVHQQQPRMTNQSQMQFLLQSSDSAQQQYSHQAQHNTRSAGQSSVIDSEAHLSNQIPNPPSDAMGSAFQQSPPIQRQSFTNLVADGHANQQMTQLEMQAWLQNGGFQNQAILAQTNGSATKPKQLLSNQQQMQQGQPGIRYSGNLTNFPFDHRKASLQGIKSQLSQEMVNFLYNNNARRGSIANQSNQAPPGHSVESAHIAHLMQQHPQMAASQASQFQSNYNYANQITNLQAAEHNSRNSGSLIVLQQHNQAGLLQQQNQQLKLAQNTTGLVDEEQKYSASKADQAQHQAMVQLQQASSLPLPPNPAYAQGLQGHPMSPGLRQNVVHKRVNEAFKMQAHSLQEHQQHPTAYAPSQTPNQGYILQRKPSGHTLQQQTEHVATPSQEPSKRYTDLLNNMNFVYENEQNSNVQEGQQSQQQANQKKGVPNSTLTNLVSFFGNVASENQLVSAQQVDQQMQGVSDLEQGQPQSQTQKNLTTYPEIKEPEQPKKARNSTSKLAIGHLQHQQSEKCSKNERSENGQNYSQSNLSGSGSVSVPGSENASQRQILGSNRQGMLPSVPRIPYVGTSQIALKQKQLYHRNVQEGTAADCNQGNLNKITTDQRTGPPQNDPRLNLSSSCQSQVENNVADQDSESQVKISSQLQNLGNFEHSGTKEPLPDKSKSHSARAKQLVPQQNSSGQHMMPPMLPFESKDFFTGSREIHQKTLRQKEETGSQQDHQVADQARGFNSGKIVRESQQASTQNYRGAAITPAVAMSIKHLKQFQSQISSQLLSQQAQSAEVTSRGQKRQQVSQKSLQQHQGQLSFQDCQPSHSEQQQQSSYLDIVRKDQEKKIAMVGKQLESKQKQSSSQGQNLAQIEENQVDLSVSQSSHSSSSVSGASDDHEASLKRQSPQKPTAVPKLEVAGQNVVQPTSFPQQQVWQISTCAHAQEPKQHLQADAERRKSESSPEVTKYLQNQLEIILLRLKSMGHQVEDQQELEQANDSEEARLSQAFQTIDNFSFQVLALHKSINELSRQHSVQEPQRKVVAQSNTLLHQFTSVIKLFQTQVENLNNSRRYQSTPNHNADLQQMPPR